jgi:hypothetical protein
MLSTFVLLRLPCSYSFCIMSECHWLVLDHPISYSIAVPYGW